jgi:hypothetical protein
LYAANSDVHEDKANKLPVLQPFCMRSPENKFRNEIYFGLFVVLYRKCATFAEVGFKDVVFLSEQAGPDAVDE